MKEDFLRVKHLYARAGFSLHYDELIKLSKRPYARVVNELFSTETIPLQIPGGDNEEMLPASYGMLSPKQKKEAAIMGRQKIRETNIAFLDRMVNTKTPLLEKMTLFWHGHFACRSPFNHIALLKLNNIQRTNATGNFKKLTIAVSQSQAMLAFLNNQQNRKNHPNENFARELMELFTIGRGHYTEQDVKEAARAFTGWKFDKNGDFIFKEAVHDSNSKTFMGKKGNWAGEDIIDIIFSNKQTAYFICEKLYRFFVNDNPNDAHVQELADEMYKHNYEVAPVLKKMFLSPWFYSPENVGNKIKSPIEFIAGLNRQFSITYANPQVLLRFQRALGQVLFYPPNVSGWNGGRSYIDSSSLMVRLKMPSTILNNGLIEMEDKIDPDDEAYIALMRKQQKVVAQQINATVNWDRFKTSLPHNISTVQLATYLLQPPPGAALLHDIASTESITTKVIQILSTPEYQLC